MRSEPCRPPTPSSASATVPPERDSVDVRMRRGRRGDAAIIWEATLQTAWDDIPENERTRLDRGKWEAHFRKKIEPYVDGDRTEKWIAETPDGDLLGYLILGESGFLTPEIHGFIYDIWVVPERRGKGVGKFLVGWASDWARKRVPERATCTRASASVPRGGTWESPSNERPRPS